MPLAIKVGPLFGKETATEGVSMRVNTLLRDYALINGATWVGRLPTGAMKMWRELRRPKGYGMEIHDLSGARVKFISGHIEFHTGDRAMWGPRLLAVPTWDGHVVVVPDIGTKARVGELLRSINKNWRPVWTR